MTVPPATRPLVRGATVLASFAMLMGALTSPAGASTSYEAAKPLGLLTTLLLFVGGPIGLFLLIWLLVVAGSLSRRPKREDDLAWLEELPEDDDSEATPPELTASTAAPELATYATPEPKPVDEPSGSTQVAPGA